MNLLFSDSDFLFVVKNILNFLFRKKNKKSASSLKKIKKIFFPEKKKMSHMSAETKKDDFRKYLEKSSVIDNLTKSLVALYEEPVRPEKPIEFIQKKLGGRTEAEFADLEQKYQTALAEIQALKTKLETRN
jgi:hypothetical protein